jgi:hypothetical protein
MKTHFLCKRDRKFKVACGIKTKAITRDAYKADCKRCEASLISEGRKAYKAFLKEEK